jgi:hypothetical protein
MIGISTESDERRRRVERAIDELASRLGLKIAPQLLADSNNTILHLAPEPLVAKVGTSHFRDASLEALDRELSVARHLASRGAPVVRPSDTVPAGPHLIEGLTVTLWQFYEPHDWKREEGLLGALLARVHGALLDYPGHLPSFAVELEDVGQILRDRPRLPLLHDEDHAFLLEMQRDLVSSLMGIPSEHQPLHGSPHEGNWLIGPAGPLLLDFETACNGPVEWDLSALPEAALDAFPAIDWQLLALLRRMRSLCVAVKCWIDPGRAPEVGEAAVVHLRLLRGHPLE